MTSPKLYLDLGAGGPGLVDAARASLPVGDRGFLYGDGLFETLLAVEGSVPLLPLHLERLAASAGAVGIPCDPDRVKQAVLQLVNEMAGGSGAVGSATGSLASAGSGSANSGEQAVRISLSRGESTARGYAPPAEPRPTLLITIQPYRRPTGPLSAITGSLRVNPDSPLCWHKSLSALEKVIARAEAARAGVDEALLLNVAGRVAEGASANLFLYSDGCWLTPPLSEGCLPGVMRRRMIERTGALEVPVTPDDLHRASGLYLTSALMGCISLGRLDGRLLEQGPPPPSLSDLLTL